MYIFCCLSQISCLQQERNQVYTERSEPVIRKLGLVLRNYRQTFPASDGNETTRHKEDSKSE